MNLCAFLIAVCLALFGDLSFAQDVPARDTPAQNVQQRADAMMDKARRLSDIRAPNAPAFQLKATFSFTGPGLETVQGTYTEIRVSNLQWRRDTVVKDSRRLEVAGATKIWLLDDTKDFPQPAAQFPSLEDIFPSRTMSFEFESIADHPEMDPPAECAITKPDSRHLKSAFGFDKKSGVLLETIVPESRPANVVERSCDYALFRKFGDYWFPHEIACFEDRHRKLDAKVVDLSLQPAPDPALFTPTPGAIELGRCLAKPHPPRAVQAPNPEWPVGSRDRNSQVMLSLVIDSTGKVQNIKVVNSGGAPIDTAAVSAVRRWRFKPATCNGEPIP